MTDVVDDVRLARVGSLLLRIVRECHAASC